MWRRPEDITTPSTMYTLDLDMYGGADLLGGTAAALAAVGMVLQHTHANVSAFCITKAEELFRLATRKEIEYHVGVPSSKAFYP
jgi:hypothetical protein